MLQPIALRIDQLLQSVRQSLAKPFHVKVRVDVPDGSITIVCNQQTTTWTRTRLLQAGASPRLLFDFAAIIINTRVENQYTLKGWRLAEARIK